MPRDAWDPMLTTMLAAGAGFAGYLGARWFGRDPVGPVDSATAPSASPAPFTAPMAALTASAAPPASRRPPSTCHRPPRPRPSQPGPVTSPLEVDASTDALPRRLDPIFERHRGDIPIEYLRALAMRESGMTPSTRGRAGWGLFQIIEVVRSDFNRAHRTSYTRPQLLDPDVNTRIATWLLRFIIDSYHRHHPEVPNLRPDWTNPRFVELVTFGWNAGPSETGGVGRVVSYLVGKGARDIDLALVHDHARTVGASKHLSDPAKVRWCRGVVALYLRERARTAGPITIPVA